MANKQDNCKGTFFEARFKSIAILDEESLLTVAAYIDLNPVAAGMAPLPESSPHTSINERVEHVIAAGKLGNVEAIRRNKSDDLFAWVPRPGWRFFCEICFSARQFSSLRRMDGCKKIRSPFFEDLMMNATNQSKCVSWSNGVGLIVRQWRVSVVIAAVGGVAMLGFALATSQAMSLRVKKSGMMVSVSAKPLLTLPFQMGHNAFLSADSQPLTVAPTVSPDGDLEVNHDFVLDGFEFAVAGAEVSSQLGPYRQIGNTVSWLVQELSQTEEARFVASKQPSHASQVANPLLSRTEKEMATWLLQSTPWTR